MQRPRPVIIALAFVVVTAAGASAALLSPSPPATATSSGVTTTSSAPTSTVTSTTAAPTSTTAAPPTTTRPATTEPRVSDPAQAAKPLRFARPVDSARHLMQAWVDDDEAEARKAASKNAVDDLWDGLNDDRDDPPTLAACTPRDGGFDCSWNAKHDTGVSMLVVGGVSAGWMVESVEFVGDSD